jgi:hypothetical protein
MYMYSKSITNLYRESSLKGSEVFDDESYGVLIDTIVRKYESLVNLNGYGQVVYADGMYEGNFENGKRHGQGRFTKLNGEVYKGNFENGQLEGWGRLTWPNGTVYEGNFENGIRRGRGRFTWPDGAVYIGNFENGKRHGQGSYRKANGKVYKQTWKKGRLVSRELEAPSNIPGPSSELRPSVVEREPLE